MPSFQFRAWDTVYSHMYSNAYPFEHLVYVQMDPDEPEVQARKSSMLVVNGKWFYWLPASQVEVMQFTGYHDKQGKPIYAGDIVIAQWCWTEPHAIRWPHDQYDFVEFGLDSAEIAVIGNLYETPELVSAD